MSKVSFPVSGVWDYSGGASIVGGYPAGGGGGGGSNDTVRLGGTGVADTSSGGKSGIAGPSGVGTKVTGFSAKEVLQKNSRYGKPEPYLEWRAVKGLVQTIRGGYTLGLFDSEHAQCLRLRGLPVSATVARLVQDRIHGAAHCSAHELRVAARIAELWAEGEVGARASVQWVMNKHGLTEYRLRVRRAPKPGQIVGTIEEVP